MLPSLWETSEDRVEEEREIKNVCVCEAEYLDELYFLLSFSHEGFCNTCAVSEPQVLLLPARSQGVVCFIRVFFH